MIHLLLYIRSGPTPNTLYIYGYIFKTSKNKSAHAPPVQFGKHVKQRTISNMPPLLHT